MCRIPTLRWILSAYALGGLALGTIAATVVVREKLDQYRCNPDGSLSPDTAISQVLSVAPTEEQRAARGSRVRRLTREEKLLIGSVESLPLAITGGLVGLFWGFVHMRIRSSMSDSLGDQNQLDYSDSTGQNRTLGST
jgi:hypothetical protein